MKKLWEISLIMLVTVFSFIGFSLNAEAAGNFKSYEYEFKPGNGETLNGFAPLKEMVITFDEDKKFKTTIATEENLKKNIFVREQGKEKELSLINEATPDVNSGDAKALTITFKNIDFIDYTTVKNLELVIKEGTLRNDQIEDYVLPFNIEDVLPGFASIFIDGGAEKLNTQIFKYNPPRDINVHVRNAYIETIETIHRFDGVVGGNPGHHLTNIDVFAHENVYRLKAGFNDIQLSRDMSRHQEFGQFTMGQAGIDAQCEEEGIDCKTSYSFELRAYSEAGRLLETRNFTLRATNHRDDFILNDYLLAPDNIFGEVVTLYDLMEDSGLLKTIVERLPEGDLDSALSISYNNLNNPNMEGLKIENEDQLLMALDNDKIKTINLSGDIKLNKPLEINRNVTINGGILTGSNVVLGDGTENLTIRLNDVEIEKNLEINVGSEGTAFISDATINGETEIISGAEHSIYLIDFTTNGITLKNTTPVRVVLGYSNDSEAEKSLSMTLASDKEVLLEGLAGTLTIGVNENIKASLQVINSNGETSEIKQGTMGTSAELTLNHQDNITVPDPKPEKWTIKEIDAIYEGDKKLNPLTYPGSVDLSTKDEAGIDLDLSLVEGLPEDITLSVKDSGVFSSNIEFLSDKKILQIMDPNTIVPEKRITDKIILRGSDNENIYEVEVSITISND